MSKQNDEQQDSLQDIHDLASIFPLPELSDGLKVELLRGKLVEMGSFELPLLPLRGMVCLPNLNMVFDVVEEGSRLAVESALQDNRLILLSPVLSPEKELPGKEDINPCACLAVIHEIVEQPKQDELRVRVEGLMRIDLLECVQSAPFMRYQAAVLAVSEVDADEHGRIEAARRLVLRAYRSFLESSNQPSNQITYSMLRERNADDLADILASSVDLDWNALLNFLNERDVLARLYNLLIILQKESALNHLASEMEEKVRAAIDASQKEYYLREQLKVIHEELGDGDDETMSQDPEIQAYSQKLDELDIPEEHMEQLRKELRRLAKYPPGMPEGVIVKNYLDLICELPWGKVVEENLHIRVARRQLDKDHYGLEKVKERLLEYLAVRARQIRYDSVNNKAPILCLVGPPGVGKTSIASSIAKALGRPYVRMSLGGVRDEADIRGHRRTYIGALPGRVINAMRQAKCDNPLILLDELDKLGNDYHGDPSSALLEVLDPEQNKAFHDHYMGIPYDLSRVLFLTTANRADLIPPPLLDRMEIIELNGYTEEEKYHIARLHLWPAQVRFNAIQPGELRMSKAAYYTVIREYTREAGVRQLEQMLGKLCRRIALELDEAAEPSAEPAMAAKLQAGGRSKRKTEKNHTAGKAARKPLYIDRDAVVHYLGTPRFHYDKTDHSERIGEAQGLAWTSVGGETLVIEATVVTGSGKLELTGQLGQVMQESAKVALAYIRSRSAELGVEPDFFSKRDINIHVPEGAIPKDGPSAGVTLTTALYSAIAGIPVRADLAMTGEITMRGRVLAIGGLKEKLIAAQRMGITRVLIPDENLRDLDDVPASVRDKLDIVAVRDVSEVLDMALVHKANRKPPKADA